MSSTTSPDGSLVEEISRGDIVIDTEHSRIHEGRMFEASILWSEGAAIADNAAAEMLIQLTDAAHTIIGIACGGDCEVYIYQGPTFSSAGTAIASYNKNHYSDDTSTAVFTHTPTASVSGTKIFEAFIPGGTGGNAIGGKDGSFGHERVLKGGNDYLITVINRAGVAKAVSINVEFYTPE